MRETDSTPRATTFAAVHANPRTLPCRSGSLRRVPGQPSGLNPPIAMVAQVTSARWIRQIFTSPAGTRNGPSGRWVPWAHSAPENHCRAGSFFPGPNHLARAAITCPSGRRPGLPIGCEGPNTGGRIPLWLLHPFPYTRPAEQQLLCAATLERRGSPSPSPGGRESRGFGQSRG